MTRQKQKDTEVEVLETFQNNFYCNVIFSCSEAPDFISAENNLGVEIVEYHGLNLNRQIEVKIKKHINKAKSIYNEKSQSHISVYLTINEKFINFISNCKQEYFENYFPIDLADLAEFMIKESVNEMINIKINEYNSNLSNVISRISISISGNENDHWQMTNAYYLNIDRNVLETTIKNKEKKIIDYLKQTEINKIILIIYTIPAPAIGLSRNNSWSSSVGSLKLTGDIEKINSSFHEVYVVDLDNNMASKINA